MIKHLRTNTSLSCGFGIVIFVISVNGKKFRAFARNTHKIRCAIHFHFEIGIGQSARKRMNGNILSLPIFNFCNYFFNDRHASLLISSSL